MEETMDGSVDGGGGGSNSSASESSLEKLLQQALSKSQTAKVRRRSVSASLGAKPSADVLWSVVCGRAGDVDELAKTYFHKTRADGGSEFLGPAGGPRLESFSEKTDVPPSSSCCGEVSGSRGGDESATPGVVSSEKTWSGDSPTLSLGGESMCSDALASWRDVVWGAVDGDGASSGYADLAGQSEPLADFFDDYLTDANVEDERSMLQETSAYQAMAKEIADLLGPDGGEPVGGAEVVEGEQEDYWSSGAFLRIEDMCEVEKSDAEKGSAYQTMAQEIADLLSSEGSGEVSEGTRYDESSGGGEFQPSEEQAIWKLVEGYTRVLSKHIMDVNGVSSSDEVDYRSWITESDEIHVEFDEAWIAHLRSLIAQASASGLKNRVGLLPGEDESAVDFSPISAALPPCASMTELLYRCALAVTQGDPRTATDYLAVLRSRTSPHGDYMERMGHYFMEALVAKLSGTGEQLYTTITNNYPSASTMLKAFRQYVDYCPYIKITHFFSMKSTLDAFEGADCVHVIHYGIQYGVEWPSLIQHLSLRPGGPPHFRMTGIDFPYPGDDPLRKIHEMGRTLAAFAKKWGVPFEFHALSGNWESFTAKDFNLKDDEVLVVTSGLMHHVSDESGRGVSPRDQLLRRIRSLNPKVVLVCVDNAACNAPLFMTRFREAVKLYTAMFNGFELSMSSEDTERVILEREMLGREILNIVACDGQTRVKRVEPYKQWHTRMLRAGFQQVVPKEIIFSKIKAMMSTFHKDYGVGRDEGWVLLGIKNQVVKASSVWKPRPVLDLFDP